MDWELSQMTLLYRLPATVMRAKRTIFVWRMRFAADRSWFVCCKWKSSRSLRFPNYDLCDMVRLNMKGFQYLRKQKPSIIIIWLNSIFLTEVFLCSSERNQLWNAIKMKLFFFSCSRAIFIYAFNNEFENEKRKEMKKKDEIEIKQTRIIRIVNL